MADLLLEAMQARQKGDISQARQLLAQALVQDPHNEAAWMMMSEVVDDVKLKRNCLQRVLLINPQNEAASNALARLNTSPLSPVQRGERYKPLIPPKSDKTPPFTPPFTWTAEDTGLEGSGDLTYPDLTGEHVNQPPAPPAKFDWAVESAEPDKTIEKIFNKVSNPDQALQPLADTDLDWLEDQSKAGDEQRLTEQEKEARLLDALVGSAVTETINQPEASAETTQDNAPEGTPLEAGEFGSQLGSEQAEAEPLLWDNPNAKTNRLVILGIGSIIYASPAESDIPHILGLFNEKKMMRDLLGKNAGTIKLDSLQRIEANPSKTELKIKYRQNGPAALLKLKLSSPEVIEEILTALETRLGSAFSRREKVISWKDKLLLPLIILVVLIALGWLLIGGLPLLSQLAFFQVGLPQQVLYNVQYYVDQIGLYTIFMIGIILMALDLVWLVINLFKPPKLIILKRI
jgi:hypothetical protein